MLELDADITGLRGADYNPRRIGEDDLAVLGESIKRLGLVKPLIVRGDLLVAGHQRTKALRRNGATRAPVFRLSKDTTTYDEVRFNQLHNGTDMDCGEEHAAITGGFGQATGYVIVEPGRITGNFRAPMANVRGEIADLIRRYGSWGGVVATQSGRVIHCGQYALAAHLCRVPLTVYVIPDDRATEYAAFLNRQYGVFSYDGLPRSTFIQTFAQMMRCRNEGTGGRQNASTLYEKHVIGWLKRNPKARVLDFGAGQGDYAKKLRLAGFNVIDLEFFRRAKGQNALDLDAINRMIDRALAVVRDGGFDAVVCDSVFNSVDSREAETSVAVLLNAFCKPGGKVFFSGRKLERVKSQDKFTKTEAKRRLIEFLDADGFTALYRAGRWFYQKFHTPEQTAALADRHGLRILDHRRSDSSTSWQVHAEVARRLPLPQVLSAVEFEFDMPVADDRRLGRAADANQAFTEKHHAEAEADPQ